MGRSERKDSKLRGKKTGRIPGGKKMRSGVCAGGCVPRGEARCCWWPVWLGHHHGVPGEGLGVSTQTWEKTKGTGKAAGKPGPLLPSPLDPVGRVLPTTPCSRPGLADG